MTAETSANTTLVINELMADNTGSARDQNGDADDWIEIYNYGESSINIGRMYLTDNQTADAGWRVPDNNPAATTIPPKGFLLIWADVETDEGTLHASFKLDSDGENVRFLAADGKTLIDEVTFVSQAKDRSYGRIPDGSGDWQAIATPTPGKSNTSVPISVVITEIMYHPYHPENGPEDIRQEYIELFNRGTEPVSLSGWRISNGVDFKFPDVMLGGREYLVVAADVDIFKAVYPSVNNVIGGWTGRLSNRSEEIEILDDTGVQIDRVPYADEGDWMVRVLGPADRGHRGWIWATEHDGGGQSLELINVNMPNEYGQNWAASDVNGVTPGAVNSVADDNVAPFILDVIHAPIIPKDDDTVLVTARILDELQTNITVTLHYRIDVSVYEDRDIYPHYDPNSYSRLTMFDDGAHGDGAADDRIYGAVIPAQQDGTIIEFYVEARDGASNSRTWPAPSIVDDIPEQVTNALYQVNNSFDGDMFWQPGRQPIYYLIMTEMERGRLEHIVAQSTLYGPDSEMNATFISVDGVDMKVRYNLGLRNRGHGTRNDFPNNYRLNFPHDRPWKGVTAVNLNKNYPYYQLAGNKLFQLSGLPQPNVTAVQVRVNGQNLADPGQRMFGSYAHVEVIDSDFASNHFPDDAGGNAYKCMRDFGPADLQYRGSDPDDYRDSYFKTTNEAQDDWSDLMDLCYVMSETPDDIYIEEVKRVADVEKWIRFFALNALLDNSETSLANGYGDDYYLFCGIEDPRFVLIQHDLDSIFGQGGSPTSSIFRALPIRAVERFLTHPEFIGRYYYHLRDLIETILSTEQLGPFLDNLLGDFVPPSQIQNMMDFVEARNQYVLSLIPSELTVETDLPQSNGYYQSSANAFLLYGTADVVKTRSVLVNGQIADFSPVGGTWEFGNPEGITETLIESGSVWRYLDDGSDQGTAQDGTNWFADPAYDDAQWLEGPAELGYGDDGQGRPEATVVNSGPSRNYFITTYLRRSFDVYDASLYSGLNLRLLRDDGAVVYLNGAELVRSNLPEGVIDYLTLANSNVGEAEEYTFLDFEVDPNLLLTGTNIIAVEIHQASATSADISFDLELNGIIPSGGSGTLWPGINRINIQAFDGPRGMGNLLESEYIDIWYDDGDIANISGTIASDTILDAVSGPWHVTSDLIVPAGATLTIEQGTTLFFDAGAVIVVQQGGRLIADGTENKRIRLTSLPGSGLRWDGIQFDRTIENNRLCYVDMEYGDGLAQAIKIEQSQVLIDNVTWTRTDKNILEVIHPYLIVSNCIFPNQDDEEAIYGHGLTGDEYLLIQGNTFGCPSGYQDVIDFADCQLPGPIIQIYDNVFLGSEDDGLYLDGADACIEGNLFVNFLGGSGTGTANAVAADQGSYLILARNVFVNNANAVLLKGSAQMLAENNTFVENTNSAINFNELGSNPGRVADLDGNIFWNNTNVFQNIDGQVELIINNSLLPADWHSYGTGNIDADPLFVDLETNFHLKANSPAVGSGPCGLDMGAYVPAGAAICGEPDKITYHTNATLVVGGPGITHYKYSLNREFWSEELTVDVPIVLNNLVNGRIYTVYVIGKNTAGSWQSEDKLTASRTWTVDTSYSKLVINEVLAINSTILDRGGTFPDLIELYYDGPSSMNLSGMSITDNPNDPRKFVFSAGTSVQPGGYLRLFADSDTASSGIHLGFALDGDGENLYLYDGSGQLLDSVVFGKQLSDLSIGRIGYDGRWTLTVPTFGRSNVVLPLGDQNKIRINEFLADGFVLLEDDFIELYNPQTSPVDMSGLYLTDNPITQPDKHPLGPLSFIAGEGFAVFTADGRDRPGHADFKLSADTDMIGLFDAGLNRIDMVIYGPQTTDVSYGRVPDGSGDFAFLELPTPAIANPLLKPATEELITIVPEDADKRVLVPAEDIGEQWRTEIQYDDSAWESIAGGPGGAGFERTSGYQDFLSIDLQEQMYATNATCYIRVPFNVEVDELDGLSEMVLKVRYDDGFVAYLNGTEVARRNFDDTPAWDSRASASHPDSLAVDFEEIDISGFIGDLTLGDNLLAIHGLNASATSSDMLISAELDGIITMTTDDFPYANALALLDGLRITELMYHASSGNNYDYIELYNVGQTALNLAGVRLSDGIDFTFGQMLLNPGQYVVVVRNLTAFRSAYGTGANVAGEYSGNLSNGGERIILSLPLPLDVAILRFDYSDTWYPATDGDGSSLAIGDLLTHPAMLSEPESWRPAAPSPDGP
ncbi:MAG: lamin tail domain-containing protein [Sedimentisphaerales bacterium]|nr:lamin tail domain-containing protein [Sedimentisphaerales bacterium]